MRVYGMRRTSQTQQPRIQLLTLTYLGVPLEVYGLQSARLIAYSLSELTDIRTPRGGFH